MKFIRFLTTLIIIQLVTLGGKVSAQDIADFELRKMSPSFPFPASTSIAPLDDNAHVLPSNQCKSHSSDLSQTNRCGFSAGVEDDYYPNVSLASSKQIQNEIDLSPLNFQCMGSGCEFEYANTAKQIERNLTSLSIHRETVAKREARKTIESVFAKASSIREIMESQFAEEEYIPYIDPAIQLGTELVANSDLDHSHSLAPTETPVAPKRNPGPISIQADLIHLGIQQIQNAAILINPLEFANNQLLQLECELCGSPLLNLGYGLQSSIADAELRLEHEKNLVEVQQNALILNGFATVLKKFGESLIDVSDSIVKINTKKVESISQQLQVEIR